jgi:hypothetical protein
MEFFQGEEILAAGQSDGKVHLLEEGLARVFVATNTPGSGARHDVDRAASGGGTALGASSQSGKEETDCCCFMLIV